jgi:hypothetical protein
MNEPCRYEREVLRAVEDGRLTAAQREHVAGCEECAAAMAVGPWIDRLAAIDARRSPLPDPAVVWLKAHLLRGNAAVDRAARPMRAVHVIAYALVAAGWAALLKWKWSLLQQWLLSVSPARALANAAGGASLSMTFLLAVVSLATMTIVLALHTILAEE